MSTAAPDATVSQSRPGPARRAIIVGVALLGAVYALLLIPEATFHPPTGAGKLPFVWNQDQVWKELEREFVKARLCNSTEVSNRLQGLFAEAQQSLEVIQATPLPPGHTAFLAMENQIFHLAPLVAASNLRLPEFSALIKGVRTATKDQSRAWDLGEATVRQQLYRIIFGGRMALEAVLVQAHPLAPLPVAGVDDEPSAAPAINYEGVAFHSGDLFLSRGSKPTSSLISRGNDYPGNYSHVAFLHVDRQTGEATIIESVIERGVITMPFEKFMSEGRLRLMALRLRADLPALRADPDLPHRAASVALKAARQGHTPYDFTMDFRDRNAMFCSEVASSAYESFGVRLWTGMTWISSPTVTAWLGSVGVRNFETQEPADLEYDPQLRVVAEWLVPTNLFQAHLDDAVTDAMLAGAPPGAPLPYSIVKLPLARAAKLYSRVLNAFGRVGPVPEGMSPTTALRVRRFCREHERRKAQLAQASTEFRVRTGYLPPYWELLNMAR